MNEETIEFYEFAPEVREKIIDFVFNKIDVPNLRYKRKREIFDLLISLVPKEYKYLVSELDDIVLADKAESIEKTTFYMLKNGDKIKEGLLGI